MRWLLFLNLCFFLGGNLLFLNYGNVLRFNRFEMLRDLPHEISRLTDFIEAIFHETFFNASSLHLIRLQQIHRQRMPKRHAAEHQDDDRDDDPEIEEEVWDEGIQFNESMEYRVLSMDDTEGSEPRRS